MLAGPRHAAAVSTALIAYRPAVVEPAPLVRREDVAAPVWTGMLLDGALVPLWHGVAVRADVEVTPAVRLAAVNGLVPHRGVVGRAAAAWVHAGGPGPDRVDVLVPVGVRRVDPHPARRAAEGPLPAQDVLHLGAGRVTTVQRTGLDVARYTAQDEAAGRLTALLGVGFDPQAALATLDDLPGERGILRARSLLTALGAGGSQARMTGWSGVLAPVIR